MSDILVKTTYMQHSGGTKFYEVVQIDNVDARRHVVVFRWGKVGAQGEIKIETAADIRRAQDIAARKIREKGARGYDVAPAAPSVMRGGSEGLYAAPGKLRVDDVGLRVLEERTRQHYRDAAIVDRIMDGLGVDGVMTLKKGSIVVDDIVVEEREDRPIPPEPKRSEDWASW